MTSTQDVQMPGRTPDPRVIRLPSLRRLLRPGPTLLLLALLVGAASAPPGQEADAAGAHAGTPGTGGAASAPQVPGWQQEADPRTPGTAVAPATAAVAPSPVVLPLSPVVLVGLPVAPGSSVGVGSDLWAAYRSAAAAVPASCHLDPRLLAAIGQVESGSLAGRTLDSRHRAVPPVLGPVLDGNGFARIPDTDHGRWDGDPVWDRAVGPMQFIPSTWARWGVDADGDGVADPQDIVDASQSAADYLCAGGRDLSAPADLRAAILSYNHSTAYLATVLALVPRMTPNALGTTGGGVAISAALLVGPPSVQPAPLAPPPSASPSAPTTRPSTSSAASSPTGTPRTASRTRTAPPTTAATTSATATSTTSSHTSSSPTSTTSPSTTSTTTSSSTTSTTDPTTSATATTTPSSSTTTAACPSGSTTSPTSSGTTTPSSAGTASPTPTSSCTTTAAPTSTPVPSTSSATAAEATLLGQSG
ncbi:hypothetical protein GCM10027517_14720 [Phycicoccus ginsengisoli]